VKLGVYLGGHVHPWPELLSLVRLAEQHGYEAAFVDGDTTMHGRRDAMDGWTLTVALLAKTRRIAVGSLRLVHHWNAARLAQAVATAERIAPGRLRFQIAIGDRRTDARFGLELPPPGERIAWLEETLDALRALWRGETVTRRGRFVRLDGARAGPAPPAGGPAVAIAARRPRMLELVATHADVWEMNLPAVASRVVEAACARHGRDPTSIARSMLIYTRLAERPDPGPFLVDYRRLNPWFGDVPDDEAAAALVVGEAADCRRRLAELARELHVDHPVLDLSGLDAACSRRVMEACSPEIHLVDGVR
jgi:alkanesulfonate monooxygenase SsuD/methylene tetrahydromethanopterin reductase-like flavin-dependent oxidoreductase (luciferase family)